MLTKDRLKELLYYDKTTGAFTRKSSICKSKVGNKAGFKCRDGYLRVWIDNKQYSLHRLAWFYVHSVWPIDELDHIDGDKHNNSIKNLRESDRAGNARNRGMQKNNSSGVKGVTWNKSCRKWQAQIGFNQKNIYLGCFETLNEAADAYEKKAIELHGEFYRKIHLEKKP